MNIHVECAFFIVLFYGGQITFKFTGDELRQIKLRNLVFAAHANDCELVLRLITKFHFSFLQVGILANCVSLIQITLHDFSNFPVTVGMHLRSKCVQRISERSQENR